MLKMKIIALLLVARSLFCGCHPEIRHSGFERNKGRYRVEAIGRIGNRLMESSGLTTTPRRDTFYTNTDEGKTSLYEISRTGTLLREIAIPHTLNRDWEDLARDEQGNYYIGDFGNNFNIRKDLAIYKVNFTDSTQVDTIRFVYPDQQAFPPPRPGMNFDCEAFFFHNDSLHLFSKNRGEKLVKHYTLPAKKGFYTASLSQHTLFLGSRITAADISPDKKIFALLSYGKIYVFHLQEGKDLFAAPYLCKRLIRGGQSEALAFINRKDMLVSNETGKLFLVRFRK